MVTFQLGSGVEVDGVPVVRCSCLGSGSARGEGRSGAPPVGVCLAGRLGGVDCWEGADVMKTRSSSRSPPLGSVPGAASETTSVSGKMVVWGEPLWSLNWLCVGDISAVEVGNGEGSRMRVFIGVAASVDE